MTPRDSASHPDTCELRPDAERLKIAPEGLPEIPGGWAEREWTIEGHVFRLVLPASPDAFLDDVDVHAAFDRDEYMPYWAYLWPSALKMAAAVMRTDWPMETDVLELGAGIGLVGLAGLTRGLRVTFSDYDPVAVKLALLNAQRAGFTNTSARVLDWRDPPSQQFPLIWGCDLLYEVRNHQPLFNLVRKTLLPGGTAWFADAGRSQASLFCNLLSENGLSYHLFDEKMQLLTEHRIGRYQLIEVQVARKP